MSDVNLWWFGIDKRELDGYQWPLSPKYNLPKREFEIVFTDLDEAYYLLTLAAKDPSQSTFSYNSIEQQPN